MCIRDRYCDTYASIYDNNKVKFYYSLNEKNWGSFNNYNWISNLTDIRLIFDFNTVNLNNLWSWFNLQLLQIFTDLLLT